MLDFKQALPLSLYIHFPWCIKKCPYCDFNSHGIGNSNLDDMAYIDALIRDLEMALPGIWGRRIISVFIGGGTPSLMSGNALERLMSVLRSHCNLQSNTEVTMEANPGTVEAERFAAYRGAGVNRLSIGIQSFQDEKLSALGRIHSGQEAEMAIEIAEKSGFENINLDLMFALPEQDMDDAMFDLQKAMSFKPQHISWYQLTIELNTAFYSQPPVLPGDDDCWRIQEKGKQRLAEQGYTQYEVSAFAQSHQQSKHNLNYWHFGDYLGIGAGAHSKITDVAQGKVHRFARPKVPAQYMERAGTKDCITGATELSRYDLALEFMMNSMRLNNGIESELFYQRTGLPMRIIEKQLYEAERKGLLIWNMDRLSPSKKGQLYLNDLLQEFMPE